MVNRNGHGFEPGLGPGYKLDPKLSHRLVTAVEIVERLIADDHDDDRPDPLDVEADDGPPAEPPIDHDEAAPRVTDLEEHEFDLFDTSRIETLPLLAELPFRARPPVEYRIDANLEIHKLDLRVRRTDQDRAAVVQAIADHLRDHGVVLAQPGDWRHIPAIGSEDALVANMSEHEQVNLHSQWGLKLFAVLLPNGDVVTPDALIYPARKTKRASRAGALRAAADGTAAALAGEAGTEADRSGIRANEWRSARNAKAGEAEAELEEPPLKASLAEAQLHKTRQKRERDERAPSNKHKASKSSRKPPTRKERK